MKIGIVINGSRGDIQPYAALANALVTAGHDVTITANVDAADLVAAAGVRFVPMALDTRAWLSSPDGQQALAKGTPEALLDSANAWLSGALPSIAAGIVAVADGADLVIAGAQMDDYAAAVCVAYGVPIVLGYLTPWLPTAQFPQLLISAEDLPADQRSGPANLATYQQLERIYWRGKDQAVNELRQSLDLPPAERSMLVSAPGAGITVLNAYSPQVVARPTDWSAHSIVTGYWRLPRDVRDRLGESVGSGRLLDWLDAGPPPVFLGFGSMPILDPAPVVEMAVAAARRVGVRILIGAGWTDLDGIAASLPDYAEVVAGIDHDWLFPRCLGVVHHGGAGTTAAGLIAGRPTFIYSLFMDQPFWGARVTAIGAGAQRRFADLSRDSLVEAMSCLQRGEVQRRAEEIGVRLRGEDGIATAIRVLDREAQISIPA